MKLYGLPGACSMSCHIAFEESRIPFEPVIGSYSDQAFWAQLKKLNPQQVVPVLQMDDGQVLTQNIAILNYIAERAPQAELLPAVGTWERAQTFQWLSWVASDLHKAMGPLFNEESPESVKNAALESVTSLLTQVNLHLNGKKYLAGERFSVADIYLFTVYGWTRVLKIPTHEYSHLNSFAARVAERSAVRTVLKREGLLK